MYKCAAIGDYDSIYAFAALGIDIFSADDESQARAILKTLDHTVYAIIYITEALAQYMPDILNQYDNATIPSIIPIPGVSANTGIGIKRVKETVEKAVGSDIIFNDEN